MSNRNALISVAMLSALLENKRKDYLDIISPLILYHLPPRINAEVVEETIINSVKTYDGFEKFPRQVLKKLLDRFSKTSQGYLEKRDNKYFVKKVFDSTKFYEERTRISEAINTVLEALQKHFASNPKYKKISIEETHLKLLAFLEKKGLFLIDGVDELRTVKTRVCFQKDI